MYDCSKDNCDYFLKCITKLVLNYHTTVTMLLLCTFHHSSLDEKVAELDHAISMLNFFPLIQESTDYKSFSSTTSGEVLDYVMEECPKKKTKKNIKKNTKTFRKGM